MVKKVYELVGSDHDSFSTLNLGYGGDCRTAKVRYDKRLRTIILVHWKCSWYSSRIIPSTTGEVSAINAIYWRVCYKKGLHNCYGLMILHCVSKNDIDVAYYNFKAHQPILVIFGIHLAERVCYQTVILLSHLS